MFPLTEATTAHLLHSLKNTAHSTHQDQSSWILLIFLGCSIYLELCLKLDTFSQAVHSEPLWRPIFLKCTAANRLSVLTTFLTSVNYFRWPIRVHFFLFFFNILSGTVWKKQMSYFRLGKCGANCFVAKI